MEFLISISRPEKSWKSNMLSENTEAKRFLKNGKNTNESETDLISMEINTSTDFMHYNVGQYLK